MKTKVFFARLRPCSREDNLLERIKRLFDEGGGGEIIKEGDLVAVKLSFSEAGNTAFINPLLIKPITGKIKEAGGKPFLTDTNTLYRGGRNNAVDHLNTAIANGFSYLATGAPLIIADGLRGRSFTEVEISKKHIKLAKIGTDIYYADALISLAHVHGHMMTGFAGTFKNIGMGCGSIAGKQMMHSSILPKVNPEKCVACGECIKVCPADAITMVKKKALIDEKKCLGCGECTAACRVRAIAVNWQDSARNVQERIVEYALAVLKNKTKKSLFYSFLLNVTPDCLCNHKSDPPIVGDIGLLSSRDPVALDAASFDLVKKARGERNTLLKKAFRQGEDKFKDLYPDISSEHLFEYAETLGMGTRKYELVEI